MNTYIIALEDDEVWTVQAKTKEEAEIKFKRLYLKKDDFFLDTLYDRSIDGALAEFWFEDMRRDYCDSCGRMDCVSEEVYIQRVKEYFGEHQEWANLFLDYHLRKTDEKLFPEEMVLDFYLKSKDWATVKIYTLEECKLD